MVSDLTELGAPETVEVVSGRKNSKGAAKTVGRQELRKMLTSGSKQRRVIPKKST